MAFAGGEGGEGLGLTCTEIKDEGWFVQSPITLNPRQAKILI